MRKKLLYFVIGILCVSTSMAVPAKRGIWKDLTLKDGTQVKAELMGDETMHYYQTSDLRAIQKVGDDWVYADRTGLMQEHARRVKVRNEERTARRIGTAPEGGYQGSKSGLVILVEFSDVKFIYPSAELINYFNQVGYNQCGMSGSVHDYFLAQSYGQFDLEFDVVGPVSVSQTASYYAEENKRVPDMVNEICKAVDSQVDFKKYDWDSDGYVDQVYVVYAGYGAAQGAENTIWPHEWVLRAGTKGMYVTNENVRVDTYGISCELKGNGKNNTGILDGIGTACHEFSHCLGLPDFYDTSEDGNNFGMSVWSLMDYGCYNDNGCTPAGYTAYERWFGGWIDPIELNDACQIQNMPAIEEEPVAYVVYNDNERNEFYLLANHQQVGFDVAQYGHGLLVTHVDYDASSWAGNTVNTETDHQRMTIIPADGATIVSASNLAGDPFPGNSGNDALTDESTPTAALYHPSSDGTPLMGKPITGIVEEDGLISFSFMGGIDLEAPVALPATDVSETGFTANWQPVDGVEEYTVALAKTIEAGDPTEHVIFSEDFAKFYYSISSVVSDLSSKLDNYMTLKGWTGQYLYRSPYNLRIGNSTKEGYLMSPVFDQSASGGLTITLTTQSTQQKSTCEMEVRVYIAGTEQYVSAVIEAPSMNSGATTVLLPTEWDYGSFQVAIYPKTPGIYVQGLVVYDGQFDENDFASLPKRVVPVQTSTWQLPQAANEPRKAAHTTYSYHTTSSASLTFSDLEPAVYAYKVRAVTSEGFSQWSENITVDLTTGIASFEMSPDMEDGNLPSAGYFSLLGQHVAVPSQRGIYIRNGRKVVVK